MPNLFIRCMLFVSSYFPLALICCLLLFDSQRFWALVILLIGLSGFLIMLVYFLMIVPKKQICVEKVTELQKRDGDVVSYVAGYLIARLAAPCSSADISRRLTDRVHQLQHDLYQSDAQSAWVPSL